MHLLAPWWLLLLLPLAGGLIVLYLLKLRRRDYVVPSVFLWEQALQDLQANAPLQKLRKNLLLLLQLIALLLIVAALSRPAMQWARPGGQSVVLVVDASASMQSTDVSPSRFALAKKAAHTAVEALGPRDKMMIVAVGGATRALTPFTTDKRALHGALNRLAVSDARADLRGALDLAAGLVRGRKDTEKPQISIISDGAVPAVALPAGLEDLVHFQRVGKRSENVGIVVLDVRRRLSSTGGYEGLIGMRNFGAERHRFTLELSINGQLRDARELTLEPGKQRTEVLRDLPATGGTLTAKLDLADDLLVDNTAQVILPKVEPVPVVLATPGNLFLQTALCLDPTLQVTVRTTMPSVLPKGAVLIADNLPGATPTAGVNALIIGTGTGAKVAAPTVVDWNRRHPVLEYVDLSTVHITAAAPLKARSGEIALIETTAGPLALAGEHGSTRLVRLGWDLHQSDFPLRAGFPIFIGNCIDWLSGQRRRAQVVNVRTGQVVPVPVPADVDTITLRTPDGRTEKLGVSGSVLTLDRLTRAGLYRVQAKGLDLPFAANLLDAAESNLTPRDLALEGGAHGPLRAQSGPVQTEREWWRLLLLLALCVLAVEWWVFHRRIG